MSARVRAYIRQHHIGLVALFFALSGGVAWATHPGGVNTINSADIIDGQVKSADVGSGEVTEPDLAQAAVTSPKVKNDSLVGDDIAPNSLPTGRITDGSLTGADVANGSLTGADVGNDSLKGADVDESSLSIVQPPPGGTGKVRFRRALLSTAPEGISLGNDGLADVQAACQTNGNLHVLVTNVSGQPIHVADNIGGTTAYTELGASGNTTVLQALAPNGAGVGQILAQTTGSSGPQKSSVYFVAGKAAPSADGDCNAMLQRVSSDGFPSFSP